MNYCQLTENRNASGSKDEIKSCLRTVDKRKSVKRTASVSFKKNKILGSCGGGGSGDGDDDDGAAGADAGRVYQKSLSHSTSKGRDDVYGDVDSGRCADGGRAVGDVATKLGQQSG